MQNAHTTTIPVGASLIAMVANDNAGSLMPRGGLQFIASKLAPTGDWRCMHIPRPPQNLWECGLPAIAWVQST
ncbi:hypothetical protein PMm318_A39030 [Pseudomonas moorei]